MTDSALDRDVVADHARYDFRCLAGGALLTFFAFIGNCVPAAAGSIAIGDRATDLVHDAASSERRRLTVKDTIEAARVLSFISNADNLSAEAIQLSNDGSRYLFTLIRGDLSSNGNWVEFYYGAAKSEDAKDPPKLATRLFTTDHRRNPLRLNRVIWLDDNETVAFLWSDGRKPAQLVTLRLTTGELTYRTDHPQDVTSFEMSSDGRALVFSALAAEANEESKELMRNGFAIEDGVLLFDVAQGDVSGHSALWFPEIYVDRGGTEPPEKLDFGRRGNLQGTWLHLSPNGSRAIVCTTPKIIPQSWKDLADAYTVAQIERSIKNPGEPTRVIQYHVVDVKSGTVRPLWNAPTAFAASGRLLWSSDSRRIFVGPTFLPLDSVSDAGRKGEAWAIIDTITGAYWEISNPAADRLKGHMPRSWNADDTIEFQGETPQQSTYVQLVKISSGWVLRPSSVTNTVGRSRERTSEKPIVIALNESPNSPPMLVAKDTRMGNEHPLLDPNRWLRKDVTLGQVQIIKWSDIDKQTWTGRLYLPVHYEQGRRFPLVVQFGGTVRVHEFSLSGDELISTAFAAQLLANRGIAVLQMGDPDGHAMQSWVATPQEYPKVMLGLNSAIEFLARTRLVDPSKVGLIGFSRTGGWVEYAITHSTHPYAAAIAADNQNSSYLQYLTLPAAVRAEYERTNGAAPLGEGLLAWIERAPGFNADKVQTPLRMEVDQHGTFGILQAWELFSQLRELGKAVELYVIPNSAHGEHGLELPAQQRASIQGTVDWMDYWLNGKVDREDLTKARQYERWGRLRSRHEASREVISATSGR